MRLARDQNNALMTDAFRPQSEQSVIHFMVELYWRQAGVLEHCISHYMEIFYDLSIFGGCLELDTKTQSH